jgi:hypothetical protein
MLDFLKLKANDLIQEWDISIFRNNLNEFWNLLQWYQTWMQGLSKWPII